MRDVSGAALSLSGPDASVQYGGLLAAQALQEQGVRFAFTLTGGHIAPILVGCASLGIRVVDVRHEATSVFAADAVSRLTGVCGVAVVTAGPGLTNTITAVKNAQLAQSPVVIMAGATAMILKGRGSLQDIDQLGLMRSAVKQSWSIASVKHRHVRAGVARGQAGCTDCADSSRCFSVPSPPAVPCATSSRPFVARSAWRRRASPALCSSSFPSKSCGRNR